MIEKNRTSDKKINNNSQINRKRITVTALATSIILASGVYHFYESPYSNFTYVVDENDNFKPEGKVKYEEVIQWYVIEKEMKNQEHKLYIVKRDGLSFYNIENGLKLGSAQESLIMGSYVDKSIINVEPLEDYLLTYDMIKAYYDGEDIKKLLSEIKKDYLYSNLKVLEK